ncbi:MAG: 30S ribosomal protein S20 [Firmicutes bacterium]|nr:30S ribosomal protein S20 [Bacillota bacterium]
MPNIKSAVERVRLTKKETAYNRAQRSAYRNAVKRFEALVAAGDKEAAKTALTAAIRSLDKAASKGIIHKNKAANQKSRLTKRFAAM